MRLKQGARGPVMDAVSGKSSQTGVAGTHAPAGISAGTGIRTLDGVLPVEFLEPGDRIVTRSGARRLVAVSVQKHRGPGLVRIHATTLGHDRPERDLLVGEAQLLLIRDWRAKALFGQEVAAIPAARLADGEFIRRETKQSPHAQVRLYTLRFDEDEVIWAEGLELACPAVVPAEARFAQTSTTRPG